MKSAEKKIKGGKFIRCKIKEKDNKIQEVIFTGDFFLHPEDSLEDLEKKITGLIIKKEIIEKTVNEFFKNKDITLIGASPADFISIIFDCIKGDIDEY